MKRFTARVSVFASRDLAAALCLVGTLLAGIPARAQTADTGTVTGTVINQATGYALAGAIVTVPGAQVSGETQRDGTFSLRVPAGRQVLEVSYTGLDPQQITVEIVAGQTVTRRVELTSPIYRLDQVVVKGVREGNASALQMQRLAINPKTVVAADAFGVPAANPGELIQRLPSVSVEIVGSEVRSLFLRGMSADFIAFQVDGNQMASSAGTSASRQFQIEQMGTGNIESVEIVKANTPDRDANAVAGFVNLITRRSFDLPGQRLTLTGGVLWRDGNSSTATFKDRADDLDLIGVQYTNSLSVLGGDHNLGIAFNFNRRRSSTVQEESGPTFGAGLGQLNTTNGLDKTIFRYWGSANFFYPAVATNVGLNLDYKLGPKSYAYVRMSGNQNYQYQKYHRWDVQVGNGLANFTATSNSDFAEALPVASSFAQTYATQFTKKSVNYSINPGVSLRILDDSAQLDIDFSHSYARIWYPGWHNVIARTPAPVGWSLDFRGRDAYYPQLVQTSGPAWGDPANYTIQNDAITAWRAPDTVDSLRIDLRKDLATRRPVSVKVGAKYFVDDRGQNTDSNNLRWTGPAGIGPYTDVLESELSGRYGPYPFMVTPNTKDSKDPVNSGFLNANDQDVYNSIVGSRANDARFKEVVWAAYAMATMKVERLTLLGGVRAEQTDTSGRGWITNADPALNYNASLSFSQNVANANAKFAAGQITKKGSYRKLHPALQAVYEPLPGLIFRGSFTRSISRAPVANLLPITSINPATNAISQGNPDLRPYTSSNIDLSVEKYFEPVGQFSIGFFDKSIKDYIVSVTSTVGSGADNGFNGQYAGLTLTKATNLGSAHIQGWEFNYQQQFSFLPGIWRGLGVQANHTILHSTGNYGAVFPGGGTGPLAGLVPRQSNVALFYTGYGWDLRLMANIRSRLLAGINNAADLRYSTYRDERLMMDFKARYTFDRRYEIFLMVDNLTDEPTTTTNILGREVFTLWQGTGYTLGFNLRL